jgi:hypothetical protein
MNEITRKEVRQVEKRPGAEGECDVAYGNESRYRPIAAGLLA